MTVRPAKTQITLGIHPVLSESSLSAWRKLGSLATHWAHSEDLIRLGGCPGWSEFLLGAQSHCCEKIKCHPTPTQTPSWLVYTLVSILNYWYPFQWRNKIYRLTLKVRLCIVRTKEFSSQDSCSGSFAYSHLYTPIDFFVSGTSRGDLAEHRKKKKCRTPFS